MSLIIDSILVAVDFSPASAQAVALAGRVAHAYGATQLRVLHAETLDAPPYFTHEQVATLERERRTARTEAHRFLEDFARTHTDYPFTTQVEDGSPGDAILRAGATADLVVMGTHGRRGVKRWWLGSVAEQVLRSLERPVLVVRYEAVPGTSRVSTIQVDPGFDTAGTAAPRYAEQFAACTDSRVSAADEAHPSLIVTSSPWPHGAPQEVKHAEGLLQAAAAPVLFVPVAWPC